MEQKFAFVGVDPIIFDGHGAIILAQRGEGAEVEIGSWHIPGALVLAGETINKAIQRACREKTGLEVDLLFPGDIHRSHVRIYDTPTREPRYHDIALSFLCQITGGTMQAGSRMSAVQAFTIDQLCQIKIGFDHRQIVDDGIARLKDLGLL